jgi:uracil-DNA glycosylase family 4
MLNEWIPALGLTRDQVFFMNVANYKTAKNRPLNKREIRNELPRLVQRLQDQVVVTLGKTAERVMLQIDFLHTLADMDKDWFIRVPKEVINLPHPSGRNRILNDREKVKQILETAKTHLQKVFP